MNPKLPSSLRLVCRGLFLAALALGVSVHATPEEEYPGTNAVTTEIEAPHPAISAVSAGLDIEYAPINFGNYVWNDGHTYSKSGYGVHLALEWLPFNDRFGKLGIGLGVGVYDISKVGLSNGWIGELRALPFESFLSYRFDYLSHQVLVPFVKIGPEFTLMRDTTLPSNQQYWGFNYTVGLELCLDRIDKNSARSFDRDFGVHHSYVIAEYVKDNYLGEDSGPDLTRDEWRVGLRFEM